MKMFLFWDILVIFIMSGLFTAWSLLIIKIATIKDFAGLVEVRLLASFHLITNKAKHVKSQQNRDKQ